MERQALMGYLHEPAHRLLVCMVNPEGSICMDEHLVLKASIGLGGVMGKINDWYSEDQRLVSNLPTGETNC